MAAKMSRRERPRDRSQAASGCPRWTAAAQSSTSCPAGDEATMSFGDRRVKPNAMSPIVCLSTDAPLPRGSGRAYVETSTLQPRAWRMAVRHLVTADALERMGAKGFALGRGELVRVTPAGGWHGGLAG